MAGHSKWANIKHRKAGQDAKRGKLFTKLIRELAVAAKLGGGEVASNPRLRTAVDKALTYNMTRETINRAIQRGVGGEEGSDMESLLYEGYGPGGTALLVSCLTDNRRRTAAEVRYAFDKSGGRLGIEGSVAYLFAKKGVFHLSEVADEEALLTLVLEVGADDLHCHADHTSVVLTPPEQFMAVQQALEKNQYKTPQAELIWIAQSELPLTVTDADLLEGLLDRLEDLDDVQTVYHNARLPDESDDGDSA
jgi:YebC/PmpR family DNA-binding regulatory protein